MHPEKVKCVIHNNTMFRDTRNDITLVFVEMNTAPTYH